MGKIENQSTEPRAAVSRRAPESDQLHAEAAGAILRPLESYSAAMLPLIEWRATADGNVDVLNDTADYYRYFDATAHAEFLYSCVEQTVEQDLPEEVRFLEAFDKFSSAVKEIVEMPDREVASRVSRPGPWTSVKTRS